MSMRAEHSGRREIGGRVMAFAAGRHAALCGQPDEPLKACVADLGPVLGRAWYDGYRLGTLERLDKPRDLHRAPKPLPQLELPLWEEVPHDEGAA